MKKMLTDAFVRTLAAPLKGRIEVVDMRCAGLMLRVTSNRAKSWSLRFRDPKSRKVTRATIGTYPDVTLEKARERGDELRRGIAAGINPVEKKRRERDQAASRTFQALADRYMTEHARRHKRTADADERVLRLHVLPHWRSRPFDTIGRRDVIELCEGIVEAGKPTQANRVQALISKVFSFAVDADLLPAHPCARLKKRAKETKGTRVLSDEEIGLFWRNIGDAPNSARMGQALRLVLLTGVRVTELAGAEVKEFERLGNVEKAIWTIPGARSKNGKAHLVPLSSAAVAIVLDLLGQADLRARAGSRSRFLLESPRHSDEPINGHSLSVAMIRFGNALAEADVASAEDREGAETWTSERPSAHDLRRTMATRLSGLGIPAEDVSACLNHVRKGVTATHYDHYDRAREKRRALNFWARTVAEIVDGPGASNIVPLWHAGVER